jgi:hypothetical protein
MSIVGTDIYNDPAHDRVPEWISFRKAGIESYYTLTKLFPSKPLYICETACRERYYNYYDPASHTNWNEDVNSQTKGEWLKSQSQDLQTDFSKVRAAVFFDIKKEHDWKVYSKPSAPKDTMETINAFESAFWKNPYFTCNSTQPIAATSTPYNNSINNIPGTVEAENFDEGKIGVGYLDFPSTEANPHNYRISDVNIGTHYGGYHIGYIQKGEYLTYSVNVSESAMYDIDVNAASTQNTGSLRFILNRAKLTGSIRLPSTSSWDVFSPTTIHNVYMPAGKYILKIDFDGEGFNLDNMVFKKSLTAGLIASKQQDEIQVFPNPTLDKVAVLNSFNQEIIEVKLYDAVGQLVTKMTHPGNDFSLSLENLNQGFYNMEITTNIGKLQKRIIKL